MAGLLETGGDWFSGKDMEGQSTLYTPEDYANARRKLLGNMGWTLIGAGLAPRSQRGAILAKGMPEATSGYDEDLQAGFKERMAGEKYKQWQEFKQMAASGQLGDLPPSLQQLIQYADPETGLKVAADYLTKGMDPVNWQTTEVNGRRVAFNPRTLETKDLGAVKGDTAENQRFMQERKLYDDYSIQAKPFVQRREAYQNIRSAYEVDDEMSDIAMVFNYMKMLDPTSTVARGEQANAGNAGGVPNEVINLYNYIVGGGDLNPNQRKKMMDQATRSYATQLQTYQELRKSFQSDAQSYGLDPERVIPDFQFGVFPGDPLNLEGG